jgi:hypothetical protein
MQCLTWLIVAFAGLAALLWGWSALVNLPAVAGTYAGVEGLADFYKAVKKVSRLNMGAAACAFISAALQAVAMYMTTPNAH